jgi:hypothetical protein
VIALPSVWHPVAGQGAQPADGETPSAGSEELEPILHTACEPVWLRIYPDELRAHREAAHLQGRSAAECKNNLWTRISRREISTGEMCGLAAWPCAILWGVGLRYIRLLDELLF